MLSLFAGLVLILPGICWWVWRDNRDEDPLESLALIFGVSISLSAVFTLLLYLIKLPISLVGLISCYLLWLGLITWGLLRKHDIKPNWRWLGAGLFFIGLVAWRMWQARELVLPAWVDSLHHVLIVRKMLEAGGLMETLSPYLPGPFYYHYAFHTFAAQFAALSGLPPAQAVLILGQLLNAAVGLSVYHLAKTLSKDWRMAGLAALLVTFATKMPAYYLSWGRYTLLTGLVLLPLAMAASMRLLAGERRYWLAVTMLTAGTLLAHYFTAVLLALFLLALGGFHLLTTRKTRAGWRDLLRLVSSVLAGLLLALPWLMRVFAYTNMTLNPELNLPETPNGYFGNTDQWRYLWYLLGPESGYALLGLALVGLVLAFWRPRWRAFALWSLVLMAFTLPWGLRLGRFRNDHFAIVLCLPLAVLGVLAGGKFADLIGKVTKTKVASAVVLAVLALGVVAWGGWLTRDVINDQTVLAREEDLRALAWIEENTPQDARFLVNTTGWGFGVSRGVDGGAWILPITGRWSLAPTIFYPFGAEKDFVRVVNDWGARASQLGGCDAGFWDLVEEARLSHIYLREGVGSLKTEALEACGGLEMIYEKDGVSVWQVGE